MGNPGKIVKLNDGRIGRTYNSKGVISEKIPVYLATETKEVGKFTIATRYSEKGILVNPVDLQIIGFID